MTSLRLPREIEVPLFVPLAQVPGPQPPLVVGQGSLLRPPVAGRDVAPPHQDLASFVQLDLLAGHGLADRSATGSKGVGQADDGRRFGHSVPLRDDIAQPLPELLGAGVKCRPSRKESPELPAESAADVAKGPPATQPVLPGAAVEQFGQRRAAIAGGLVPLDLVPQQFQDAGNGRQHRDSIPANGRDDLRGIEGVEKEGLATQQGRHENAHHLAEDMAEGQQAQEADGMDRSRPLGILADLVFEGSQIGQQVPVGEANPLGLRRGPRGKHDLGQVVAGDLAGVTPVRGR